MFKQKLVHSIFAAFVAFSSYANFAQAQTTVKGMETVGVKIGATQAEMELALKNEGYYFWRKSTFKAEAGLPERIATAHYKKDGRNLEPDFLMVAFSPVTSKVVALSRSERFNVEVLVPDLVKNMSAKYGTPAAVRGTTEASWVEKRAGKDSTPLTQCEAAAGLQINYSATIDNYASCKRAVRLAMSPGPKPQIVWRMTLNLVDFETMYDETMQLKNALKDKVDIKSQ
ncbi:hypothetical protein [Undibacterium flavidum]|uniref:Uncharacterized protein n=1 Tax=Undibacterium flavidum TaxID=2762297 RepID=A0ABR6Y8P8_9BURK|nr:hypothetical protein [Undibacterium flavidum]MBC3872997.1 hypothetical protein [Undibacterium flavidum]